MAFSVTLRMYGSLNDFLPAGRRHVAFQQTEPQRTSVKDLLEAAGVPHTEIDLILANDERVGFDVMVAPGDRIAAFPVFRTLEEVSLPRLQPARGRPSIDSGRVLHARECTGEGPTTIVWSS